MAARTLTFRPFQTFVNATSVDVLPSHLLSKKELPTPAQVFLEGVIVPGWRIREPLVLSVERDEDSSYIISDALFNVYGVGATHEIALEDYIESLIEYYEILERHDDAPTVGQMSRLRVYLQPVAA